MSLKNDLQGFQEKFGACDLIDKLMSYCKNKSGLGNYRPNGNSATERLIDRIDEKYSDNLAWFDIKISYRLRGTYKYEN